MFLFSHSLRALVLLQTYIVNSMLSIELTAGHSRKKILCYVPTKNARRAKATLCIVIIAIEVCFMHTHSYIIYTNRSCAIVLNAPDSKSTGIIISVFCMLNAIQCKRSNIMIFPHPFPVILIRKRKHSTGLNSFSAI